MLEAKNGGAKKTGNENESDKQQQINSYEEETKMQVRYEYEVSFASKNKLQSE